MERGKQYEIFIVSASTLGLIAVALSAFSKKSKHEIHERDGYVCVSCGSSFPLEASHIDHDRNSPLYNDPDNGETLCPSCHLQDHIDRAGDNGLSKAANDWAIEQLRKRI